MHPAFSDPKTTRIFLNISDDTIITTEIVKEKFLEFFDIVYYLYDDNGLANFLHLEHDDFVKEFKGDQTIIIYSAVRWYKAEGEELLKLHSI